MVDKEVVNFDYDPKKEPICIIDTIKRMREVMLKHTEDEEERAKSPDWEYKRIHIASKEIAEIMLSPDTPLEIKRHLEYATFVGYEWVHKDENNIFTDDKI